VIVESADLASLKREKDDAAEVREGFECGLVIRGFNDIKEGDVVEAFEMREIPRS
jgi:translation initiation factor IF-2